MLFSTILLSVSLLPLLTSSAPIRARHGDGDDDQPSVPSTQDPKEIQALNSLFTTFTAETACNKGQVACVKGGTATCAEDNDVFELTPCATGLTCFASPGLINGSIPIGCTTEAAVTQALKALGVDGPVAVPGDLTQLPSNLVIVTAAPDGSFPTQTGSETLPTATATSTGTDTSVPEPTCIPDDGDDDGEESSSIPTFQATLGDPIPTGTVVATDVPADPTCTEEPEVTETGTIVEPSGSDLPTDPTCTEEPDFPAPTDTATATATESATVSTLTLILVPNPTAPGEFITSTLSASATSTQTVTVVTSSDSVPIETSSITTAPTGTTLGAILIPGPTITPSGPLVNPIGTGQIPAVPDVNTIGVGAIPAKVKRQQAPIGQPGAAAPITQTPAFTSALDAQTRNAFVFQNPRPASLTVGIHCGNQGTVQCIDGQLGTCTRNVDGTLRWAVSETCGSGTECYWVPSDSIAPTVTCTTFDGAAAQFAALGLSSPIFGQ
jgi:hypothetical protein